MLIQEKEGLLLFLYFVYSVNNSEIQEKEGLFLFLSFLYSVNDSENVNILKLFAELRNDKNIGKPSFSYLTLTFSMILLLLRMLNECHFHIKWYHSKLTLATQSLACPTLFIMKSGRELDSISLMYFVNGITFG